MPKPTPVQEYGAFLGAWKRAMENFAKELMEGFRLGYSPSNRLTPEQQDARVEMRAQAAYKRRVEHERQVGLAFVRNEARRVRRELGLDPNDLA